MNSKSKTKLLFLLMLSSVLHGQDLVFTEVADAAGVSLPDTLTESLAWGDYDGDGDQDLYLTNNGPNNLFRNDGGGVFVDVTGSAGVGSDLFSVGAAFGDLDNDGDLDLYVVTFQSGGDVLYRNNGDGTFSDVAALAGLINEDSSRGVAFVDYDRDGLLDIYVNAIGPDILYHNLGDLKFEEASGILGPNAGGLGVGVVASDLNNDGWVDIYNGNRSGDLSNLWLNESGVLRDVAQEAGVTATGLGMGVLAFDYNNDLAMDLYWTTWPGDTGTANALYRNNGAGAFVDVAAQTGVTDVTGWGISSNAGDLDNDGWIDFFVTNGFSSDSGPNALFRNRDGQGFDNITHVLGGGSFDGRGVAFADYDGDGDLDFMVTGGPDANNRLWRNDTQNGNHFLSIRLVGSASNASAIGARVQVVAGETTAVREVSGGAGRGSFNSLPVHFGLGASCLADEVRIFWPSGQESRFLNVSGDQMLEITEPAMGQPDLYKVVKQVSQGPCASCESPVAVAPWIVNNTQWYTQVAVVNGGANAVRVCMRALDRQGVSRDVTISIPSNGVFAADASQLFGDMSGYSITFSAEGDIYASILTFNKTSASGRSPSQTAASEIGRLTSKLLFGYVPGNENAAVVVAAPSTSEDETVVKMELFAETGVVLAESQVILAGNQPLAILASELFPDMKIPQHAAIKATSANGALLAGANFIFNLFREPSMSQAFALP